jgi:signal transduction histidine kinase
MREKGTQCRPSSRQNGLGGVADQLIASVSHEIRTPLAAVVGYAQLLNDDVLNLTEAERREMITTIAGQGSNLTNIVEDLVVAARADDGLLTVASVPVNLFAQARQVLETLDKGTGAEGVHLGQTSPRALADPGRVRQIIRNLVTNALRYGGDQVRVSCREGPDVASLTVADNGSGVPVAGRKRNLEPYQHAHSRPGLTASIGLGLSVSRKLARLMDGDLIYGYSNGWSTFRLELPPVLAIAGRAEAEDLPSWVTTA